MADSYLCQAWIVFTIPGNDIEQFPTPESDTFEIATESLIVQSSLEVYLLFFHNLIYMINSVDRKMMMLITLMKVLPLFHRMQQSL